MPELISWKATTKAVSSARVVRVGGRWWFAAAVAAGAFIRFSSLGHQSFWSDEVATWEILHKSFGALLPAIRASESTPPLYYFLAWPWAHVFGFGELGVRSLSAVFGSATIVAVGLVARQLAGSLAAAAAAWIAATMPLLVWYSQEARSYSLLTLLSAASLGAMLALRSRPRALTAAAWTAVCIAALATHYFAGFLVAGELCVLVGWPGPRLLRRMLVGPALAMSIAIVPIALLARDQYPNTAFVRSQPLGSSVARASGQLLVGYGVDPVLVLAAICTAIGIALCVWPLILPRWRLVPAILLLAVLVVSVALPVVVALGGAQLIYTRNVLYVLPTLALLAGAGAARTHRLWAAVVPVLAGLAVVTHVYSDPTLQRTNSRGVATAVGPARQARALLVMPAGTRGFLPYFPGVHEFGFAPATVRSIVLVGMSLSGGLNRNVAPLASLRFVPPPGFREVKEMASATFSLRVFQAAVPRVETAEDLARRASGTPYDLLLQPATPAHALNGAATRR